MRRFVWWRYLCEWLRYTPFFFKEAPKNQWYKYFVSSHRIASGFVWYKGEEMKCDTPQEMEALDTFVLECLAQRYEKVNGPIEGMEGDCAIC